MRLLFFIFLLFGYSICAQNSPRSLDSYTNEQLLEEILENNFDSISSEKYAREYLRRGINRSDSIMVARAYDRLARMFNPKKNLKFSDSVIAFTAKINHITYPGLGHLLKGDAYEGLRDYKNALDNYLISLKHAEKHDNYINWVYLQKKIIGIKSRWSSSIEAINMSKELLKVIDTINYESAYTKASRKSFNLTNEILSEFKEIDVFEVKKLMFTTYLIINDLNMATQMFNDLSKSWILEKYPEFKINLMYRYGELNYFKGNFSSSFDTIMKYKSSGNISASLLNSYYYLGMNKLALNQEELGYLYLLKADSIFNKNKALLPSQRNLLIALLNFYKKNNNVKMQLETLNKINVVDSIFKINYRDINPSIIQNFETPKLLAEKQSLIEQLEWENGREKRRSWFIACFLLLSVGTTVFYFKKQKSYKKRFNTLLEEGASPKSNSSNGCKTDISAQVVNQILNQLEDFQEKKMYLSPNISLQYVAKQFKTNSSYLSKVVNLKKDKNFSQYINELRVDYAVNELKTNPRFRKYTIKAIAEDVGFGNSQSFSKAFYSRTGIQPSYFVRNLNKHFA